MNRPMHLGGLDVDHQLELFRSLDRQFAHLRALKDAIGIDCRAPAGTWRGGTVLADRSRPTPSARRSVVSCPTVAPAPQPAMPPRRRRHLQPCRLRLRSGAQHLCLPRWCGIDQHGQYRSRPHRLLQSQQKRLLAVFIEAEVHDGDRAQNHPRPQRRCAGSCPCVGQYGSLPAVAPRAQEGRDAICAHETDSRARPLSAAGLERRQGRSAAYSNAQNLRRLARLLCRAPPPLGAACLA